MDMGVSLCILANTAGMATEHFDGSIDMTCTDPTRCPNNIVIMSDGFSTMLYTTSKYLFACLYSGLPYTAKQLNAAMRYDVQLHWSMTRAHTYKAARCAA